MATVIARSFYAQIIIISENYNITCILGEQRGGHRKLVLVCRRLTKKRDIALFLVYIARHCVRSGGAGIIRDNSCRWRSGSVSAEQ